ncbi:MAG: threonine synthase [Actinomycetota bacterium]|nr:threonine synthase [Actinomycetota bacterium]
MASFVTHLECSRCGRRYGHLEVRNLCECGGPLLVEYDLDAVRGVVRREDLPGRTASMWRYRELLPVEEPVRAVTLGEGFTPLFPLGRLGTSAGLDDLWLKDDGLNPTGTFKARGAAAGMTAAVERGVREVALPTAGNAGAAWAAYGAAAGVAVHVAMPRDAPETVRGQCRRYGAEVTLVDGFIGDAAAVIAEGVRGRGWFDAGTLREPYRIEGKKTLGLEIAEQLDWRLPDAIVYPAGGGVGIIGIWRALNQLAALGWVQGDLPRLIVVQAEGCAPMVKAFHDGAEESEHWPDPHTIAQGLRVPKALGDFLVLRAVRETGGTCVAASDDEIRAAVDDLAAHAGVLACPEGAATLAAAKRLRQSGQLRQADRVVLINTGTGLADTELLRR